LHHVTVALRELFCCREIGDGFGAVVNAALAGIENLRDRAASLHQLTSLLRRLERIQVEPFLSISRAAEEIEILESAGLNVEPAGFRVLEDWLNVD
jgi:hypothetical protein